MVSAARAMAGSSRPVAGLPPVLKPNAGECPALPGRYLMVNAVSSPDTSSQGTGHHAGGAAPKS